MHHYLHALWDRPTTGPIDSCDRLEWARAVFAFRGSTEMRGSETHYCHAAERIYGPRYLAALAEAAGHGVRLDPELWLNDLYLQAAHCACQAVADATTEALATGPGQRSWCLSRPGSHHASARRVMGGCVLNNLAVAAAAARANGARRVAIIDFDAHHGNGTQEIFADDPHVLCASLHQYPFFPGTGTRGNAGACNEPLAAGAGGLEAQTAYIHLWEQTLAFKPDIVLFEAGLDGHHLDPTSDLCLDASAFTALGEITRQRLDDLAVPAVLELGGGYTQEALTDGLGAFLDGLEGPL